MSRFFSFIGILILFEGVLMLGFVKVRPKDVEGIIFISLKSYNNKEQYNQKEV